MTAKLSLGNIMRYRKLSRKHRTS